MYKIYINENILELRDTEDIEKGLSTNDSLIAPYSGKKKTILSYIDMLEKTNRFKLVVLHHSNVKKLWKDFKSLCLIIKAAGGVVENEHEKILLIFRKGHWDLPKGKMESKEKKKQTAIREVEEETGVKDLKLGQIITKTFHIYKIKNQKRVLKKTYWYRMNAPEQPLVPQEKEDITKAEWHKPEKISDPKTKTYKSIIDVLEHYALKT